MLGYLVLQQAAHTVNTGLSVIKY